MRHLVAAACLLAAAVMTAWLGAPVGTAQTAAAPPASPADPLFRSADHCMACHNGLTTPSGEDVSIGTSWRASMMAHSARDPYWQAAVRREVIDFPAAQAAIEHECSRCHMPMAHMQSQRQERLQPVFASLGPIGASGGGGDPLALEGVSCALCHQITSDGLGQTSSFTGGFTVDTTTPLEQRQMFGPYDVDQGRLSLMRSATGFIPATSTHIQQSEVCATCHTLYTHALTPAGEAAGGFPEQVPYLEWLRSEYRDTRSCQSCHMPVVDEPTPIASVLGEPREGFSRHDFRGANFFMLSVLNRFRSELGVVARPAELDRAIARTTAFLTRESAAVAVARAEIVGGRLEADVVVENLAGHKLPTGYPSRRIWLHLTVADKHGRRVFSSGAVDATGAIAGNDNDRDASRFEPHHRDIRTPDEVQIYEAILGTASGAVTTGLLSAVSYLKDNRLPPRGFDKGTAPADVAVHGAARDDPDFGAGADRVRYSIDVGGAAGPFTVAAELWYQPIAYRWARNLAPYAAAEPRRFVAYYEQMAAGSALRLARGEGRTAGAR